MPRSELQQMEHHMKYTEAQLEAQNLEHSLAQHQ